MDRPLQDLVVAIRFCAGGHEAVTLRRKQELGNPRQRRIDADEAELGVGGLVVRDLGPEGRRAGAALHSTFELRSTGDYSAAVRLSRADAIAARDAAQSFVAYCRTLQRKSPQRGK